MRKQRDLIVTLCAQWRVCAALTTSVLLGYTFRRLGLKDAKDMPALTHLYTQMHTCRCTSLVSGNYVPGFVNKRETLRWHMRERKRMPPSLLSWPAVDSATLNMFTYLARRQDRITNAATRNWLALLLVHHPCLSLSLQKHLKTHTEHMLLWSLLPCKRRNKPGSCSEF